MLGRTEGRRRRGHQRMRWLAGWHHQCNGHELGQTSGDGKGQGCLLCCSPWVTEQQQRVTNTTSYYNAFLVAQMVKNPPAMQETWVRSLGWGDPLEEGLATHFSILAWRIHGQRSLVGYNPSGRKELDTTE